MSVRWRAVVPAWLALLTLALAVQVQPASAESFNWYYGRLQCYDFHLDLSAQPVQQPAATGHSAAPVPASGSGSGNCTELGGGFLIYEDHPATFSFSGTLRSHNCLTTPVAEWTGTLQ